MATGEKKFSIADRKVHRFDSTPFPAGPQRIVVGPGWEVKQPGDSSKSGLPYVNGFFLVPDVGEKRRLYHMMFCDLTESDNGSMAERGGGPVEFGQALGRQDLPVGTVALKRTSGKSKGEEALCLSPKTLAAWLNSIEGTELRAMVKVQKGTDGYKDKNVIEFFITDDVEVEGSEEEEGIDDEESSEESEVETEESEESEETDESEEEEALDEIEEEEPKKPAKVASKPSKPSGKPAPKKGKK